MINKKNSYVFIGPVQVGKRPIGGAIVKNQFLFSYLKNKGNKIFLIDTYKWKYKPLVFIRILFSFIFYKRREFIISLNTISAYKISHILKVFSIKNIKYFVIGDSIRYKLINNEFDLSVYKVYKGIYTESRITKNFLNSKGLKNVYYLPNFKNTQIFDRRLKKFPKQNDKVKFVFLSRIIKEKGVELIIEAVKRINSIKGENKFCVTFFGPIPKFYSKLFFTKIENIDNIFYEGFINLNVYNGYRTLASYHVMLFPTFWHGEGFPGIFIDAFVSGLPVVASDWNINKEIINENNGILIDRENVEDLIDKMMFFIDNPKKIQELGQKAFLNAEKFDVNYLLDKVFIR